MLRSYRHGVAIILNKRYRADLCALPNPDQAYQTASSPISPDTDTRFDFRWLLWECDTVAVKLAVTVV